MAIRKTKDGKWYTEVYLGIDPITGMKLRKTKTFDLQKDAKDWERKILNEYEEGTINLNGNIKLKTYLDYWHNTYAVPNTRVQTQERYKQLAQIIKRHLGEIKIGDLKTAHIDKFYADMQSEMRTFKDGTKKRKYVGGTILKTHRLFKQAMDKAVAWEMIARNPVEHATTPKANDREIATWTIEECMSFLDKLKGHVLYLPVFIAIHTGLRRGEICALQWDDVNLKDGYLLVRHNMVLNNNKWVLDQPKTESSKNKVVLTKELTNKLKEVRKEQNLHRLANGITEEFEYVCCWQDGRPLSPGYVSQYFRKEVKKHGFKKITFHGLRHTHASILFQHGASSHEISKRLRHSEVSTTDNIYIHITEEIKKSTAELFDKAVEQKEIRTDLGQID